MHRIDLNCDLGESFGSYRLGNDEKVLQFVTSANIACGYHGGDPGVMRRTVRLALEHGVAIGAHPGYPDLQGFGRRFMDVSPQEAEDMVLYQIGALSAFVKAEGGTLRHVKPHGALYNAAVADDGLADAIARAVQRYDPDLILFGLSGSSLVAAGEKVRVRTASEAFADRTYQSDGSLTSRRDPAALIEDHEVAVKQATRLVKEGRVASRQGTDVEVRADTICIHGDGPHAVEFARLIRTRLPASGIEVGPIGGP